MNAAAAYQRRTVEGASPVALMVLLYQAVAVHLRHAVAAMEFEPESPRQIEARTRALHRVLGIVGQLKGLLPREGGELARHLAVFSTHSEQCVLEAVTRRDPQPLRSLQPQVSAILDAWRELEARPAATCAGPAAWTA